MKIVFLSNYFTHHQKPFCEAMYGLLGKGFVFIETEEIEEERKKLGWESEHPTYAVKYDDNSHLCEELINDSDVVIVGSAPAKLVEKRIRRGKLVFFYSERIYKKKCKPYKYFIHSLRFLREGKKAENVYMFSASAYTAADYAKTHTFVDKCYKWGYFPETKEYKNIDEIIGEKKPFSILWVARFIDWKHPEIPIAIAKRLKEDGYNFKLNMIGKGELEDKCRSMIDEYDVADCVDMLGSMKPEQVRERMEKAQIFMFTSDRNEGWGAVLNEAMNSACAVVASHAIGSVPFLIKDGINGQIYQDGNEEDLYLKIKKLLGDRELCCKYGKNAYSTVTEEWNATVATSRFMKLTKSILHGEKETEIFKDALCSKAEILEDNWYTI